LGPAAGAEAGAIRDFQTQILDGATQQKSEGQTQEAGEGSANAPPEAFPSGRLGETWHDGYKGLLPNQAGTSSFRTGEATAFGSSFYKLPRSFLDGQVQIGVFGGYDSLSVKYASADAKSNNESFLFGGYGLYTRGANYIMATVAGAEGETRQNDGGASLYDTHAFFLSLVGGHVHQLGFAAPLKLDVRGGVSYMDASGDRYTDPAGQAYSTNVDGWSGSVSATLFAEKPFASGALLRPYIKGEVREQFSYDNTIEGGNSSHACKFGEASTAGIFEAGLDYVLPSVVFNAAVFDESATDRITVGGKLGAKIKLN
jgi:hypothetical protein